MLSTGEIIKKHREKKGLRQTDLAEKCSCTSQFISGVERNAYAVSSSFIEKCSEIFEFTLEEREAISFYEDYRTAGIKTKLYIEELESEVRKLKQEIEKDSFGRDIANYVTNLSLRRMVDPKN